MATCTVHGPQAALFAEKERVWRWVACTQRGTVSKIQIRSFLGALSPRSKGKERKIFMPLHLPVNEPSIHSECKKTCKESVAKPRSQAVHTSAVIREGPAENKR